MATTGRPRKDAPRQTKRQWRTDEEKARIYEAYREWKDSPWSPKKLTSDALAESLGVSKGWMYSIVREVEDGATVTETGKVELLETMVTRLVMDNTKLTMDVDDLRRRLAALEAPKR